MGKNSQPNVLEELLSKKEAQKVMATNSLLISLFITKGVINSFKGNEKEANLLQKILDMLDEEASSPLSKITPNSFVRQLTNRHALIDRNRNLSKDKKCEVWRQVLSDLKQILHQTDLELALSNLYLQQIKNGCPKVGSKWKLDDSSNCTHRKDISEIRDILKNDPSLHKKIFGEKKKGGETIASIKQAVIAA